jgi:oxaloacetate decarboxylase gamma subunit
MPISDLLLAGLELMLIGMGIVFGFLTALVFVLHGMSRLASLLDKTPAVGAAGPAVVRGGTAADDEDVVAAITAAVSRYRAGRRG